MGFTYVPNCALCGSMLHKTEYHYRDAEETVDERSARLLAELDALDPPHDGPVIQQPPERYRVLRTRGRNRGRNRR